MTGIKSGKTVLLPSKEEKQREKRFRSLVRQAQGVVFAERVVPKVIVPLSCAAGLFASSVWTGMWSYIPHAVGRPSLLGVFALAALAAPFLVPGKFWTPKSDGTRRLDENLGEPSEPARMINSSYSYATTREEKAWYEMHRQDLLEEWGQKFTVGRPKINIQKSWRVAAASIAALTVATAMYAGPERGNYMREAFNFEAPVVPVPPPVIHAWLKPPKGIKQKEQYLSNQTDNLQSEWTTHQDSTLNVRTSGTPTELRLDGKEVKFKSLSGEDGKKTQTYKLKLKPGAHVLSFSNGPTWTINVPPDNPPEIVVKDITQSAKEAGALSFACDVKDDHGVVKGEVKMALPDVAEQSNKNASGKSPSGKNSQALPAARLPQMTLPGSQFCNK